jgi:nucleotide-binding universal stress UspA family protein
MYKKILVATDGTKLSKKAVKAASQLAVELGANLTLVQVVPKYPNTFFDGSPVFSVREIAQLEEKMTVKAKTSLNELVKDAVDHHIGVSTTVVKSSNVSEALLKVAQKTKADLIVMASHGRGGIKRVLIGSETLQVLTHSEIPVLVIR